MALDAVLAQEPGHPQQLVLALMMLGCCASAFPGRFGYLLLGAVGAGLVFTKINVGIFFMVAAFFLLVCGLPAGPLRKAGTVLLAVYAFAFPPLLMHRHLMTWAGGLCAIAVLSSSTVFLVGLFACVPAEPRERGFRYVTLGAVSGSLLILAAVSLQGMSLGTLVDGVLRQPMRLPDVFHIVYPVSAVDLLLAALGAAVSGWLYRMRTGLAAYGFWLGVVRCGLALFVMWLLRSQYTPSLFFLTLLPLVLIPPAGRVWTYSDYGPRLFVAGLSAAQLLQIYPVAGSQIAIAMAPSLLWAFLCLHDGMCGMAAPAIKLPGWTANLSIQEAILGGLMVVYTALHLIRIEHLRSGYPYPPSSLSGTSSLHLAPDEEKRYELLVDNIRAHCDLLFTMPGMGSLNLWSGVPTPNGMNLTAWMEGIDPKDQERILEILKKTPRACAVYNPEIEKMWGPSEDGLMRLPLARYIIMEMPVVYSADSYELRIHP
jgi:hypothetical protein